MIKFDKEEIYEGAKEIITNYLRLDHDEIVSETHIVNDVVTDSILIFRNLVEYIYNNTEES